jgi:hypothetical protein
MPDIDVAVVDRNIEVEWLIRTAERNHSRTSSGKPLLDKPVLLYSSQTFGAGKTTFGTNVIHLLGDATVQARLLNPPATANNNSNSNNNNNNNNNGPVIPSDLADMRRTQTFTKDLVDSYAKAKTIFVDLKGEMAKSSTNPITFEEALYHAMFCSAVGKLVPFRPFIEAIDVITPSNLIDLLIKETGHNGKWFFFIDEIGYIEGMVETYKDLKNPAAYVTTKPQHIDAYTRLFDILHPFITREDSFVFCAGKSANLTEKSLEESGSPLRLRLLALSALQPAHIIEAIRKTTYNGQPLQKVLGISDALLPVFAQIVYDYTGGIPRLIRRVFESLVSRNAPIPQDKDGIIKVFC